MRDLKLTVDGVEKCYQQNRYMLIDGWYSSRATEITVKSVRELVGGNVKISGTVLLQGEHEAEKTTVTFNPEEGTLEMATCTCSDGLHTLRDGLFRFCPHAKYLMQEFIRQCYDMKWPYRPKLYSSDSIAQALHTITSQVRSNALKDVRNATSEGSDLLFSYAFGSKEFGNWEHAERFYVTVQIGTLGTRKFIVKEFSTLMDDLTGHESEVFGKDTVIALNWEKVPALDQKILHAISLAIDDVYGYSRKKTGQTVLSDSGFFSLLQLFHESELPLVFEKETCSVLFEMPKLSLTIEKRTWGTVALALKPVSPRLHLFERDNALFFIDRGENTLYAPKCDDATLALVQKFFATSDEQILAPEDFVAFCQNLLPLFQKLGPVSGLENLGDVKLPQSPVLKLYLDDAGELTIAGKPTATYEEGEYDILPQKSMDTFRNSLEETRFSVICNQLMQSSDQDSGNTIFTSFSTEEQYFAFLSSISAAIAPYGQVFVSDKLQYVMPTHAEFKIDAELANSGLLTLDIKVDKEVLDQLGEILSAYKLKRKYFRLKGGKSLSLEDDGFSELSSLSDVLSLSQKDFSKGKLSVPSYRAFYVDSVLKGGESIEYQRSDTFKAMVRSIRDWEDNSIAIPQNVTAQLRGYQTKGFQWLTSLSQNHLGGILADDMGLGKTLEMLTTLVAFQQQNGSVSALVVAPASLLLNWVKEMHHFTPSLNGVALLGSAADRKKLLDGKWDVVVTSYDLIRRDEELFQGRKFDFMVLDEAQTIKNNQTKASKAVKDIDADHRFALTGTPIQNRLSDLWSIFDFLMPGFLFSSAEFRRRWELPASKKGGDEVLEKLKKITGPFVLRRLKANVLRELPKKTVITRTVSMETEQKKLYQVNYVLAKKEFNSILRKKGLKGSKIEILALLTKLRQICCDPALLYENYTEESAKVKSCMELVQEAIDGGHSILLFSQFTTMLDILQKKLQEQAIPYYRIDGSTSKEKRQEYVERFQSDDTPLFLISLKAGGLGLNLTKADTIVIYDPWWNVAQEEQASDRAYRIGQTRSVQVYRLICEESIEEKIQLLQEKKKHLIEGVLQEGEFQPALDETDWVDLFN